MTDSTPSTPQDLTTTAFASAVDYTLSALGRSKKGTLIYDGKGTVTLIDGQGNDVFSSPLADLGKVKRAEMGLYMKPGGQFVFVGFNMKEYALKSGVTANIGLPGLVYSHFKAESLNQASGLNAWTDLFKQANTMGLNASTGNPMLMYVVIPVVALVVIIGAAVVVPMLM